MHAVVCWALISAPHFKKHVALRMMLFLSLSDALQLVIHLFCGILILSSSTINLTINQLMIAMSWIGALLLQVGYHSQGDRFYFSPEIVNWLEDVDHTILFLLMRYFKIVCLIVGLIAGVGMFLCVIYQNCSTRPGHPKNRIHTSTEMRLFIQTCCSPLLGLINLFIWTYFSQQVANGGIVAQGLVNFEWILINGIHPYISIVFAKKLRNAVAELLGLKRSSNTKLNSVLYLTRWSRIRPSHEDG
ncbi:hypothetical protein M3Y94_00811500 [Aphelenchoides besseyi]|nr:hypothetical protein M3Y94_00811500 [Aphelenchoides besseyi]